MIFHPSHELREFNQCHDPATGRFCSTTFAGLTSARTDVPSRTGRVVLGDNLNQFRTQLQSLPGVSNVSVQRARGAWKGGREPSWLVSYSGNGAARRLLAQTGKQYNQDAVLMYTACKSGNCTPITDWQFSRVPVKVRTVIEHALGELGFGGWTWVKRGGSVTLRIAHIPQWPTDKIKTTADYLTATGLLGKALTKILTPVRETRRSVAVHLLTGDTYDQEIAGRAVS